MGVTLIVRRDGDFTDPQFRPIEIDEWLALVDADPELSIRTADHVAGNPRTGQQIRVTAQPGEADLDVDGEAVPLLQFRHGELVTGYRSSMEDPDDPVRQKIAAIAGKLNAVIAHDAGDDLLNW